jgi:hypothetical protein
MSDGWARCDQNLRHGDVSLVGLMRVSTDSILATAGWCSLEVVWRSSGDCR